MIISRHISHLTDQELWVHVSRSRRWGSLHLENLRGLRRSTASGHHCRWL